MPLSDETPELTEEGSSLQAGGSLSASAALAPSVGAQQPVPTEMVPVSGAPVYQLHKMLSLKAWEPSVCWSLKSVDVSGAHPGRSIRGSGLGSTLGPPVAPGLGGVGGPGCAGRRLTMSQCGDPSPWGSSDLAWLLAGALPAKGLHGRPVFW